jgi:hypothetical protein
MLEPVEDVVWLVSRISLSLDHAYVTAKNDERLEKKYFMNKRTVTA